MPIYTPAPLSTQTAALLRLRVRRSLLILLAIMIMEGLIAALDYRMGDTLPAEYFYVLPVIAGGFYLGLVGGIAIPVLSILLFHVAGRVLPHREYVNGDVLWLLLLIIVGTVTARIQQDRHRARAYSQQLEKLSQAREELTALIAHDLRTPLAGILNVMRLINEEDCACLPPEHIQMIELALATGEDLNGIIGDLLSLHRMEHGVLELRETELHPGDLVEVAVRQVAPLARQRSVTITTEAEAGLPTLYGDEVPLTRVLVNLLGNALRFSPRNSTITVSAARTGAELVFCVADQGPGIPENLKEKIFDKFASIDHETGKHISTGLGLAFAKMAVEAHAGRIWTDSPALPATADKPAHGSRFYFAISLTRRP